MPAFSDLGQQSIVLHIAGAYLENIGVLGDQRHTAGFNYLGDDWQSRLLPGPGQKLQAGFLQEEGNIVPSIPTFLRSNSSSEKLSC